MSRTKKAQQAGGSDERFQAPLLVKLWPTAGQALGLVRSTTYDQARKGRIPTKAYGRVLRVSAAWLAEQGRPRAEGE
jgi:hypothetical protein